MNISLNKRFIFLYVLIALTGALIFGRQTSITPTIEALSVFPKKFDEWSMTSNSVFSDNVIASLKATDYLSRGYRDDGNRYVSLYVGYHDGASSGAVHSPRLCLPGGGWNEVSEKRTTFSTGQGDVPAVQSVYQKGDQKLLILYWFRLAGQDLDNHYKLKLFELGYSFLYRRKDTALIRIEVPIRGGEQDALDVATKFIRSAYPLIIDHLPTRPG